MRKRRVEIFVAGCPICEETVKKVHAMSCASCDIEILNVTTSQSARDLAFRLGVKRVPTVVVDGKVADCCQNGGIDEATLRGMGVGVVL